MKILIIAPRFHTNFYYQIKALMDAGHEVSFIAMYRGKSECYDLIEPVIIGNSPEYELLNSFISKFKKTYLKSNWELMFAPLNMKKLRMNIEKVNSDLIILKEFQSIFALSVLYYAKIFHKDVIILTQTSKNHIKGSKTLLKFYLKILKFFNVKYFITPTTRTFDALTSVGVKNISYIPFTHKLEYFNKEYFLNNHINILSVGKFIRRKDFLTLLRSINILKNEYDIRLNLIGEKADIEYINEMWTYISENKMEVSTSILFNKEYNEVLDAYRKNDLFILPSYNETAAVSVVEAMANKLPVICSDDCGTNCYILEGVNGYIFKKRDATDLALKIEMIIENKTKLMKMGNNSYEICKKNHDLDAFTKKFHDILGLIK